MPFGKARRTGRDFRLNLRSLLEEFRHGLVRRHGKIHDTGARTDGRQHILRARGAQQPDGMFARLLNLLQQHIRGAFEHTVHVFDDDDSPRRGARHLLGGGDQVAYLIDADGHLIRGEYGHVGMRAGKHLLGDFGRFVAKAMVGALQRRREGTRHIRTAGSGRPADQP